MPCCSCISDSRAGFLYQHLQISEDYALRASRSQESCYMLFYVRSDASAIEDTDKENLPLARATLPDDADSQNHHQEQSAGSAAGAFL